MAEATDEDVQAAEAPQKGGLGKIIIMAVIAVVPMSAMVAVIPVISVVAMVSVVSVVAQRIVCDHFPSPPQTVSTSGCRNRLHKQPQCFVNLGN